MEHIIIRNDRSEEMVIDLGDLQARFARLTDTRQRQGRVYPLPYLLMVIVLAKLSGEHTPAGMAEWARLRGTQLMLALAAHWRPAPSSNTIRRTLAQSVVAAELQAICRQYLHEAYGGHQTALIAIDGKTLRGTLGAGQTQGVHVLSAYLPEEGVTLAQEAVVHKENEIVAAPRLLNQLTLKNKVVSGDAMFAQRALSVQVLARGGDYLWFVKGNQPTLAADVQRFFQPPQSRPGWSPPPLPQTTAQHLAKGHGRLEQRTLTAIADTTNYLRWPGVAQVIKLERHSQCLRTGECRVDVRFGITSLTPENASAERLLQLAQGHWGIENGLHYRRDTTLREDQTRMSQPQQAEVVAVLNSFIVGLARKLGLHNLASAQRRFDAAIGAALRIYL